jgi:hypothetical protein
MSTRKPKTKSRPKGKPRPKPRPKDKPPDKPDNANKPDKQKPFDDGIFEPGIFDT